MAKVKLTLIGNRVSTFECEATLTVWPDQPEPGFTLEFDDPEPDGKQVLVSVIPTSSEKLALMGFLRKTQG